jgi:hypothetical protein
VVGVPEIEVVDSTWICVRPAVLAALVAEPANWRRWWPDLDVAVREWRGEQGVLWIVRPGRDGLAGSMELWLEAAHDGVVAHYFLRLDRTDGRPLGRRRAARLADGHRRRAKRLFWGLGDQLDPGRIRRVSEPPSPRDAAGPAR